MRTQKQATRPTMLGAAFVALSLIAAACGGDDAAAPEPAPAPAPAPAAPEAPADEGVDGERPDFIAIGTGGTGGTAYPLGGAIASMLAREMEGVNNASAETTGGSIENIRLVHSGQVEMGQIQADVAFEGCSGIGRFEGDPQNVYTYVVLYPNVVVPIWLKDSGISDLQDLVGRRVGVGDAGSGTDLFAEASLRANGLSYDDFRVQYLPLDGQTAAFRDRQLDVAFWSSPRIGGTASLQDLAASADVDWSGFSEEELANIAAEYPYYSADAIPANTFTNQPEDLPVAAVWHNYLGRTDLADDYVYDLVSLILANVNVAAGAHPAGAEIAPSNIVHAQCLVHPGAARAHADAGFEVPAELIAKR